MFSVTITAANGAGLSAVANVLNNVTSILYDWIGLVVTIYVDGNPSPFMYSLSGVTTVTTSISGKTVVIS